MHLYHLSEKCILRVNIENVKDFIDVINKNRMQNWLKFM